MDKFGRSYSLKIQATDGATIAVELPFTVEFDIVRNTLGSANLCKIRIYNLGEVTRNRIRKDPSDYSNYKTIELKAGYGKNLPVIFSGSVTQAWSVREGVNFITQIECFDGGYAITNSSTDAQFPAGETVKNVVTTIASDLGKVTVGAIGGFEGVLTRSSSYSGNTAQILQQLTGNAFFIDNGKAYALKDDEYSSDQGPTVVISSDSGLLATPVLEFRVSHFDIIFEPSLNLGRRVLIDSLTGRHFNGVYKIVGIKHRGMISEAVCGSVVTTGEFYLLPPTGGTPVGASF